MNGIVQVPHPVNEPVKGYGPGSPEKASLKGRLVEMLGERIEIPLVIGGREVRTGRTSTVVPARSRPRPGDLPTRPERRRWSRRSPPRKAAWREWSEMPWEARAAVFLKAAELLAGPWRDTVNAATMLGQSKTVFQAEIDAACEIIDFWRFNAHYMQQIYREQPISPPGIWDMVEYRPLEGFVFAVTPFNFTSIGANLPTAPALMGNTVLWKPASTAVFSNYYLMQLLEAAGLPPGVINFVPGRGADVGDPVFAQPRLRRPALHRLDGDLPRHVEHDRRRTCRSYKSYPRIVGETGGKDFVFAHPSADVDALATALVRGAFEYQGQKCSAASRAYVPASLWPKLRRALRDRLAEITHGLAARLPQLHGAVIDRASFDNIMGYIADRQARARRRDRVPAASGDKPSGLLRRADGGAHRRPEVQADAGGDLRAGADDLRLRGRASSTRRVELCDTTSPYALTGAIFAHDRRAIEKLARGLRHAAGNFYVNDKPTGAVVGQQPFGGARASGTNDKAGSMANLMRWISQRTIKENFVPPTRIAYAHMQEE